MKIIPAVDIKDGKCVRLIKGEFSQVEEFGDPVEFAKKWIEEGAERLHVVDLDGARIGVMMNKPIIEKILEIARKEKVEVEVGGGIRSESTAMELIGKGAKVVIGTGSLSPLIRDLAGKTKKENIGCAIDAKEGKVSIMGWQHVLELNAVEWAKKVKDDGVGFLLFTDIERDGTLCGPALERTAELVKTVDIPVIASGGICSIDDLKKVEKTGAWGVIVGMALYKKNFKLAEAIKKFK